MSVTYINAELRRQVFSRAAHICEYCRIHEDDTFFGCQIDHIISEKHGGATSFDNLALACTFCNLAKGSDIGSITSDGIFTRFFNPRIDVWSEHFSVVGAVIQPITTIGQVTTRLLQFNSTDRLLEREALIVVGRYPMNSIES